MKRNVFLLAVFAMLILAGVGCIQIGKAPQQGIDGGVFASSDNGQTWAQSNAAPTAQGIGSISGINVMDLVFDPQDNGAIYLASAGNGLFYTWDGAKSWYYVAGLGDGFVNSVAVDYKNKCVIYAALQNKIWKSTDCNRSWKTLYYDTRTNAYISAIAVDPANSNIVYAGLSVGDMLKSTDAGASWLTVNRFDNKIVKILINPSNSSTILAATESNGLWKSADSGKKWTDLRSKMTDFGGSNEIYDLDIDKWAKTIYLTSKYGITKSANFGDSWSKVDLLTPPGSTRIYSFAVNPNNSSEIYYSTASTFYSSTNGGTNWGTKKLPTGRAGTALLVDPKDGNLIYLGTRQFKK